MGTGRIGYEVRTEARGPQPALVIRARTTPDGIAEAFSDILPEVQAYCERARLESTGPPFGRYFEYGRDVVNMAAGVPVGEPVAGEGRIEPHTLPGGTLAQVWHIGPYTRLRDAYDVLEAWFETEGRAPGEGPWEVYWTGPGEEPASSRWRTEILWPVR